MASKLILEDLTALYELLWTRFQEDRETLQTQYEHLRKQIHDQPERYAINGDTLAKYAELLIKQTSQVVEVVKLAVKDKKPDSDLSDIDIEMINKEIQKNDK